MGCKKRSSISFTRGDYSKAEKQAIYKKRKQKNSIYNKKHFDEVLKKDKTTLSTLSHDKDRTKNTDMFYATHKALDKHQYNAMFNRPIPKMQHDEDGKSIGNGQCFKYRIDNSIKSDIKVASEDSGAKSFMGLYSQDRDFYNFVHDSSRMENYFLKDRYKFKGYRESKYVLDNMRKEGYTPTEKDMTTVYRMFNYVIPYAGDERGGNDMFKQRAKFFKSLSESGYGAVLDTNDAIYGGFKATSPIIVFDMEQVVPKGVYQTTMKDKTISKYITTGRKILGV